MIRFLGALFRYEGLLLLSQRHHYLIQSLFFQTLVLVGSWVMPEIGSYNLTIFGIFIFLVIVIFQTEAWMGPGFETGHFQHLSLQQEAFTWAIFTKIWVMAGGMLGFFTLNFAPWILGGMMNFKICVTFAGFFPYLIALHALVFSLTRGHLQATALGPLLLAPLEIPVLLSVFSDGGAPGFMGCFVTLAMTFPLSLGIRKVIQIQVLS